MRLKITITGLVQGVGFRPFIYRLAKEAGLKGYVLNDTTGIIIEAEGKKKKLEEFLTRIDKEKPSLSKIYSLQHSFLPETGFKDFKISESREQGEKKAFILPDISTCPECFSDISSLSDRRYLYPFTNCTNCGPRFTIIQSLPYDRKNTSMKDFKMCPDCEKEYKLHSDRRFHAQPDACPECGPWVSLYNNRGELLCEKEQAVEKTADLINNGRIIALKGIGGFHLICDATDKKAVDRLRERKHREEKPMAVMFTEPGDIKKEAYVSLLEERALNSIEKPIVILKKRETTVLAGSVSPGNTTIGAFLPYTPLHKILLEKLNKPVVATSANMTDEPIVKDKSDAFSRLSKITDYVLSHNREIVRRCDDSVVRIVKERQIPLRRSRGFAPLPISVPFRFKKPILALGPYMNNTIAVGIEDKVFMSQHIGDLDTPLAIDFYENTVKDLLKLLDVKPQVVVSDMHPGYYSTKFGEKHFKDILVKVQHHFAHILSCMAENEVPGDSEVIGFAFDGAGYGTDKTIWGSEVFTASYREFKRVFHLRPYRLPGGDRSVKEPCRTALSLLYEIFREKAIDSRFINMPGNEKSFLIHMIKNKINSPVTTSMGRFFDGISSLINLKHKVSYHAQAAIALEQLSLNSDEKISYPYKIEGGTIDFRPLIERILVDLESEAPGETIAKKFHNTIVDMIISISEQIRERTGISAVVLSGGVFQNMVILGNSFSKLNERGFTPMIHQIVPPNDGGIALGQVVYGHLF